MLLTEVSAKQIKDLTPKAKHLFKRAVYFKKKATYATKSAARLRLFRSTSRATSTMDKITSRFFQSQIDNEGKKPPGRRYTVEDKVLALALMKQSGAGYRFLSKLFKLPSRKTVSQLLNRIPIKPGLHREVLAVMKAEVKQFKDPLEKCCVLMFDEVAIQPNLHPNLSKGRIEGFEDLGFKRSNKIANHAQVSDNKNTTVCFILTMFYFNACIFQGLYVKRAI